ncbi:hypothetical protein [Actinacidiphila epipremni]|uniref:Uncharacterized protein n=1 Tax=Actinacidiphila epipremni TaxID=2053013 RepID=A0ABX0ZK79_9ACTN|nr:hypothetical protein [Actinacidiphila epipremni]NJP42269.1 hypothetical protein [Actinacidiphila epipremni]
MLEFSDPEIRAKAAQLGLIYEGHTVPAHLRSRVVAALVEERRAETAQPSDDGPYVGGQITIRPGAGIELDGNRLPAAAAPVEITVSDDPAVPSTVRLTLLAHTVQTIKE